MHKSSYSKMEEFKKTYLNSNDNLIILDIGSYDVSGSTYNYRQIFNESNWSYNGLDLSEGPNVDIVVKDPYDWKEVNAESYDVIISGQAFEHIEFFWLTMEQINRALKPGGLCCIIAPSTGPVHNHPLDCYRFNSAGMKALGNYVNLNVIESSTNTAEGAYPWYDSVLIAKKPLNDTKKQALNERMDIFEKKLDLLINKLNK